MKMAMLLIFGFGITTAGCASSNIQFTGTLDSSDKTVTVPPGSSLLLGPIKQSLRQAGWRIVVDRGPVVVQGQLGQSTHLETGITFKTRYRLAISQRQVDVCIGTGLPMVAYDVSFVDNTTGEESMTASGKDCVDLAGRWFAKAIASNGKNYCTSSSGRFCATHSTSE